MIFGETGLLSVVSPFCFAPPATDFSCKRNEVMLERHCCRVLKLVGEEGYTDESS